MAFINPALGSPPAVSDDIVEGWQRLADEIDDALAIGGEPGLSLLMTLMPEWLEAVTDINAARMTSVSLVQAGLRDEGLGWHASGFDDVADRLTPERDGWEAWEKLFAERGITTPRIDEGLKQVLDAARRDHERRDEAGRSLGELTNMLRRNVLGQGMLGERLTILESIRRLDPESPVWVDLIAPIRRRRAEEMVGEIREAIAREDRVTLDRLRQEVVTTEWIEGLPQPVTDMLNAAGLLCNAFELRRTLEAASAALPAQAAAVQAADWRQPTYDAIFQQAMKVRDGFASARAGIEKLYTAAVQVPETAAWASRAGIAEAVRRCDAAAAESLALLDSQQGFAKVRNDYGNLETKIRELVEQSRLIRGTWDRIKVEGRRWLENAGKCFSRASQVSSRSRTDVPASTQDALDRLAEARNQITKRVRDVEFWEKAIVVGLIGMIAGTVLLLVGTLVIFTARG